MSAPQQRQPARNDEALDILRRLEPTLTRIETEQRRQAESIAEIKGQLKAVPSIWQIVTVVGMVNGIALALATYLRH